MNKKEFQKFVKQFRGDGEKFPMAMMFGSQIRKRQATINCGHTSKSNEVVEIIINSGLDEFVEEQNAKYKIERELDSKDNVISQIRIYY